MEEWDASLGENDWNPAIMDGAIPICHLGGAVRHWLVVDGQANGQVWRDDRAGYEGIRPHLDSEGRRVRFAAWYMTWLERALTGCHGADTRPNGKGP